MRRQSGHSVIAESEITCHTHTHTRRHRDGKFHRVPFFVGLPREGKKESCQSVIDLGPLSGTEPGGPVGQCRMMMPVL